MSKNSKDSLLSRVVFYFMCLSAPLCVCVDQVLQRSVGIVSPWKLELQMAVRHLMWVVGIKLQSSV